MAWSFTLRLLLCLMVAFNGVSPSMASLHVATATSQASHDAQPPCHGAAADEAGLAPIAAAALADSDTHADDSGCCDGGPCSCACLQHPPAALASVLPVLADAPRGHVPMAINAGREPATWPVQIRPPIG